MLKIEHLTKEYNNVTPIKDLSVEIRAGDVISLIGPSGTGKSTLLRMINRMEQPTSGKIFLDGIDTTAPGYDVTQIRRKIGMVFQSFNLFSHLNVLENITVGPERLKKMPHQEAIDQAMHLLKQVGLSDKADEMPENLSGGQKQRVAIARAIAMEPEMMLFDEPTSALDTRMVQEVLNIIDDLAEKGMTMLIVTHELDFARQISNRVFYMDNGGIYEEGSPEQIFEYPQKELTRRFITGLQRLELTGSPCDFESTIFYNRIRHFCKQNNLNGNEGYHIYSLMDELMVEQLMKKLPFTETFDLSLFYDKKQNCTEVDLSYGGDAFNLLEGEASDLSTMILKAIVKDVQFCFTDRNHLHIVI